MLSIPAQSTKKYVCFSDSLINGCKYICCNYKEKPIRDKKANYHEEKQQGLQNQVVATR